MNEVIEVVQAHINKLNEDLQVIQEVRSGKKSRSKKQMPERKPVIFPNVKVQPHWLETLEAAAKVLPNYRWLCVAFHLDIKPKTEQEIREAIEQAIAPFDIVDSWLIREMGIAFATKKKAKEYRTAWLNHMIEQCRSMQPKEQT